MSQLRQHKSVNFLTQHCLNRGPPHFLVSYT